MWIAYCVFPFGLQASAGRLAACGLKTTCSHNSAIRDLRSGFKIDYRVQPRQDVISEMGSIVKSLYELDVVDRRILALIQRDARLSHAEIAEQVGASSASCWRRIKALEAAGILVGCVRLVDPERIGRSVNVVCNVRVKSYSREASESFEEFVRESPEILECYSMSGDWDFLLRIAATDVADYNVFLMEKLLRHPNVASASSHFALETIKYTTELPI